MRRDHYVSDDASPAEHSALARLWPRSRLGQQAQRISPFSPCCFSHAVVHQMDDAGHGISCDRYAFERVRREFWGCQPLKEMSEHDITDMRLL